MTAVSGGGAAGRYHGEERCHDESEIFKKSSCRFFRDRGGSATKKISKHVGPSCYFQAIISSPSNPRDARAILYLTRGEGVKARKDSFRGDHAELAGHGVIRVIHPVRLFWEK